ncbi:hypothetical protein [Mangrovicoccus sp. HB161399]|uniref:hypothetical protein n=1 Tax=Mangrovicoccus sp. HB161399 TaxID=2720392 RepID=UPI001556517C|nr:hypothetical protein [Mangrovicoccus sp. HB161399]
MRIAVTLAMAGLYYLAFWPCALLWRLRRPDPLELARAPEAESYWRAPARQPRLAGRRAQ